MLTTENTSITTDFSDFSKQEYDNHFLALEFALKLGQQELRTNHQLERLRLQLEAEILDYRKKLGLDQPETRPNWQLVVMWLTTVGCLLLTLFK